MEEQLVLHFAAEEDAPTYYSVNWRNAYNLARHTNVVELVKDRHGEHAGQMVGNILQLGHARVGDLVDAYDLTPNSKRDSGIDTNADHMTDAGMVNGIAKTDSSKTLLMTSTSEFHTTLRALLRSGILVKVGMRAYIPPSDLQEQMQEAVISAEFPDGKVTGPKKAHLFKLALNTLKRKWREDDAYSDLHDVGSRGAIKRPSDHFKNNNKRVKVNGELTNGLYDAADGDSSVAKLSVLCCCSPSSVPSLIMYLERLGCPR